MENLPKLRNGYHYRVVTLSDVPYLAICRRKIKGIFKKMAVRVIEFKVPITISSDMESELYHTAIAMRTVTPKFFLHDMDNSTIDQLNIGLEGRMR